MLLMLTVVLAGCSTRGGNGAFPTDIKIPADGAELDPAFWDRAGAVPKDQQPLYYSWGTSWILPLNFYSKNAQMPNEDMLVVSRNIYNDLGFPLFLLPLRWKYSAYVYEPESPEPAEGEWVSWTPFWVTSSAVPEGSHEEIKAGGAGLFFSHISMEDPYRDTKVWQSLWSIGPAYVSNDSQFAHPSEPDRPYQNTTVFLPVAAGGFPGALVWLDATVKSRRADQTAHVEAHGPLLGTLGYLQYGTERQGIRDQMNFVVTGLLWTDLASSTAEEPESFAAHGPIWTMFGYGKKNGRNTIRLFWIPIKV